MDWDPILGLKELVRINTTNPPGQEMPLLLQLKKWLCAHDIPCSIQESAKGRGNIMAWLEAKEPKEPPLFLISHIDVVPAQPEQWQHAPFEAQEADGYIYGRGTVDTKQLTIMELWALFELKRQGGPKTRDVFFLATSDEEAGSTYGIQWFLEHEIEKNGCLKPGREWIAGADVISEGGGFPIRANGKEYYLCETGQKSCGTVEFTVRARRARGIYLTSGDGMARAMGLAGDIGSLELEGTVLDTVRAFKDRLGDAQLSPMMQKILQAMQHNTMTVTMITGRNINEVHVTCDVRLLPGFGREYLETVLDRLCRKWDCEAEILSLGCGYESSPDGPFLKTLEEATLAELGKTREETEILPFVSMGSSDGHYLTGLGTRVFGYSPVMGWDITFDQAVQMIHGVNERIHRESVLLGCRVLARAVRMATEGEKSDD